MNGYTDVPPKKQTNSKGIFLGDKKHKLYEANVLYRGADREDIASAINIVDMR